MKKFLFLPILLLFFFDGHSEAQNNAVNYAYSCDFTKDGVHYYIMSDGKNVYVGPEKYQDYWTPNPSYYGDIVIPAEVTYEGKTYAIYHILPNCFTETQVKSVTIEAPIKELGHECFSKSTVEYVSLPPTITSLGNQCFMKCKQLETVIIPSTAPLESLGTMCFYWCKNLKALRLPDTVKELGEQCFKHTGLTSFDVPASLTKLPAECFKDSELESISFPNTMINNFGSKCFCSTKLKSFEFPLNFFSWQISGRIFENCTSLEKLVLRGDFKYLDNFLFRCFNLKEVYIYNIEPPGAAMGTFEDLPEDRVLYVPIESVEAYKAKEPWNTFTIIGIETDEIEQLAVPSTVDNNWYNLNGQRVSTPGKGIFIHDGKKVLVK